MPIGAGLPASRSLGQRSTGVEPDDDGMAALLPQILQAIQAGQSHFDPGSAANSPVPAARTGTPSERASMFAPSPGAIGGGIEGSHPGVSSGAPFASKMGLSTGPGGPGAGASPGAPPTPTGAGGAATGGETSSVVGGMMGGGTPGTQSTPSIYQGRQPNQAISARVTPESVSDIGGSAETGEGGTEPGFGGFGGGFGTETGSPATAGQKSGPFRGRAGGSLAVEKMLKSRGAPAAQGGYRGGDTAGFDAQDIGSYEAGRGW